MGNNDVYESIYQDLKSEFGNDNFVDSIKNLIEEDNFSVDSYIKLLEEEFYE